MTKVKCDICGMELEVMKVDKKGHDWFERVNKHTYHGVNYECCTVCIVLVSAGASMIEEEQARKLAREC